jgi:arsenate reductase
MAAQLYPTLQQYIAERETEFNQISDERKALLERLSAYIKGKLQSGEDVSLNFICTHNSRRSHLGQIWARVASIYHSIRSIKTYSGGTEATAFNENAVATLERAGFQIENPGGDNPEYAVRFSTEENPMICFSKTYDDPVNPSAKFGAIMTCSDADEACPNVPGADFRIPLKYEDPKISDGTPEQEKTYDERCAEIAREMLFLFSKLE